MTFKQLWATLSKPAKAAAAADMAALRAAGGWPDGLTDAIAETIRFRPSTVRQAEPDRLARLILQAVPRFDERQTIHFLTDLHLRTRADLAEAVLNALALPHDGATVDVDAEPGAAPTADEIERALHKLTSRFPSEQLRFYVDYLIVFDVESWAERLGNAAAALAQQPGARMATAAPPDPIATEEPPRESIALPEEGFTSLDKIVIRSIVSSLNEVDGSLPFDELDDLVQEVVELNDSRTRSQFHRGFLDALLDRPLKERSAGENRDRRAWYLAGFVQGQMRRKTHDEALSLVQALQGFDREVLLYGDGSPGGRALAPLVIVPLLERGALGEAIRWLDRYVVTSARRVIPAVIEWAKHALLTGDPAEVGRVLQIVYDKLAAIKHAQGGMPNELERDLRRRLAVVWRRQGQMPRAKREVDGLLQAATPGAERSRLLRDKGLIAMGVRSLEQFAIPEARETRVTFLSSLESARPLFEESVREWDDEPVPHLALAMPVVAAPDDAGDDAIAAIAHLRQAVASMLGLDEALWNATGLHARCRFYLSVLELGRLEPDVAPRAVDRLIDLFDENVELPLDLLQYAVIGAVTQDAPRSAELAARALDRYRHRILASLDVEALARRSAGFREAVTAAVRSGRDKLKAGERWEVWRHLLRGALAAEDRDVETARTALDELESLAEAHGFGERFLALLDADGGLDPAWSPDDIDEARIRLFERAGKLAEARTALVELTHRAIGRGDADIEDLIEKMVALGAADAELEPLRGRLRLASLEAEPPPAATAARDVAARILFVGGDERQAAYRDAVRDAILRDFPRAELEFEFPGWGSNWGKIAERIEGRLDGADAIVLMRFVRTNLGRTVRRLAGERDTPWVACTGHGRDSIERAIRRAIAVAGRPTAGA